MAGDTIEFTYRFAFDDAKEKDFRIALNASDLSLQGEENHPIPEWVRLNFFKCTVCPLDEKDSPNCPAALALYKPIVIFKDFISHKNASVRVSSSAREYSRSASLHLGLSSLVGLLMATSGCPVLSKLRPMVRYHLPFADEDETSYRAISMYLMAQFLIAREGGKPDWELKGLASLYDEVMQVNKGFVERLRNTPIKDASLNAIINLDCFAMNISFALSQDMLEDLKSTFDIYLSPPQVD